MLGPQLVLCDEPVEQILLGELTHSHRVLDGGSGPNQAWSVPATVDGHHVQVDLGRKTPVEADLLFAEKPAPGQRTEVEKAQVQGLFDFVGVRSGEKDPGNVGFHQLQLLHRMVVTGGVQ